MTDELLHDLPLAQTGRSKTDLIKELSLRGLRTAEIARRLGIRYSFAYNVLRNADLLPPRGSAKKVPDLKLPLERAQLLSGGFELSSAWLTGTDGDLTLAAPLPKHPGVYAFVLDDQAVYVGVALQTLAVRMRTYLRGHSSQPTNVFMRERLLEVLRIRQSVDIYTVCPPDQTWNEWPLSVSAGLEVGLIKRFYLPWNRKGG